MVKRHISLPLVLALAATLAAIMALTLVPDPRQLQAAAATPWYCLLCGDEGLVDVLLNVALFVPFGFALGLMRTRPAYAWFAGLAISMAIELVQAKLVIGRDPSLSDVLTNSSGAWLGAWIGLAAPRLWRPGVARARQLTLASALAWLAMLAFTGTALQQDSPHAAASRLVQAPDRPLQARFDGDILDARVDWATPGLRLAARVRTAGLTERFAPILEIEDGHRFPAARLGQLGQKPTYSSRLRATDLLLRTPTVRIYGGVIPPAPVAAIIEGGQRGATIWTAATINGHRQRAELALTPGAGWMLLLPLGYPFDRYSRWTSAVWLAVPLLLVGFWAGAARLKVGEVLLLAAVVLLLGLEGAPVVFRLVRDGLPAWGLGVAAILAGWSCGRGQASARSSSSDPTSVASPPSARSAASP